MTYPTHSIDLIQALASQPGTLPADRPAGSVGGSATGSGASPVGQRSSKSPAVARAHAQAAAQGNADVLQALLDAGSDIPPLADATADAASMQESPDCTLMEGDAESATALNTALDTIVLHAAAADAVVVLGCLQDHDAALQGSYLQ